MVQQWGRSSPFGEPAAKAGGGSRDAPAGAVTRRKSPGGGTFRPLTMFDGPSELRALAAPLVFAPAGRVSDGCLSWINVVDPRRAMLAIVINGEGAEPWL
jgi:hypothetical protein